MQQFPQGSGSKKRNRDQKIINHRFPSPWVTKAVLTQNLKELDRGWGEGLRPPPRCCSCRCKGCRPTFLLPSLLASSNLLCQILLFTDKASFFLASFLPSFLPSLLPSFLSSFLPCFPPSLLPSFLPCLPPLLPSFLAFLAFLAFLPSFLSFLPSFLAFLLFSFLPSPSSPP